MNYINPAPLKPGDTIGIVSPSSPFYPGTIDVGINYLKSNGFKIKYGKHVRDSEGFLAGTDENRAQDIMDFFLDPEIKAIIVTRGGQGSQRLLPLLDYEIVRANPKILIGFSDTTALQLGILSQVGLITYTGYTLTVLMNPLIEGSLKSCLHETSYKIEYGETVNSGVVRGPLIGGNLSLICSLMGTPYQPNFKECILLFEDVGIEPYNIDRMLSHLFLAGVFNQVFGIIIGQFEQCVSQQKNTGDGGIIEEVIHDWSSRFRVPCIKDFPYGHGEKRCVLPIGKTITLDATDRVVVI